MGCALSRLVCLLSIGIMSFLPFFDDGNFSIFLKKNSFLSLERTCLVSVLLVLHLWIMSVLDIPSRSTTIWELCCFCQDTKDEKLLSPYVKSQYYKSYNTIETDIDNFIKNGVPLPFHMTKDCLIVPTFETVSETLLQMKAVFHKTCRDLVRAKEGLRFKDHQEKQKSKESIDESCLSPKKKTRSSFNSSFSRSKR